MTSSSELELDLRSYTRSYGIIGAPTELRNYRWSYGAMELSMEL